VNILNGARYAIRTWLENGEFRYKQCKIRERFVSDADDAIHLLRQGKKIWLVQSAPLFKTVQRAIEGRAS